MPTSRPYENNTTDTGRPDGSSQLCKISYSEAESGHYQTKLTSVYMTGWKVWFEFALKPIVPCLDGACCCRYTQRIPKNDILPKKSLPKHH